MKTIPEQVAAALEASNEALEDFKVRHMAKVAHLDGKVRELETMTARVGFGGGPAGRQGRKLAPELQAALTTFGRTGTIQASLSVGEDPGGGFTVHPQLAESIYSVERDSDPMMGEAEVIPVTSDAYEEIVDRDEAEASWVGETGPRDETDTPELAKQRIPVHEMYAAPRSTQKLLDDSSFNIADFIIRKLGVAFGEQGGETFVTGNGVGKPRGITTYPTAATADASRAWGTLEHVASGAAGAFVAAANDPADPLIDLVHRTKARYRSNGKWQMNSKTFGAVRKLKDGQGNYLVEPDYRDGASYRLLGYPVVENEFMPDIAADSLSIAFGDWKRAYRILDRSLTLLRDPFTAKPWVVFYSVRRLGGDVRDFNALKFLKFAAA